MHDSLLSRLPGATGYDSGTAYDEAFGAGGAPRAAYRPLLERLAGEDLHELTVRLNETLADRGVVFGGDDPHPFRVDPVPRLLTAAEWDGIAAGLRQRVRALEAFVGDVYGEQRAVAEGVVPERVVAGSSYFERDLAGFGPRAGAWIGVAGMDLVRDQQGRFRVLEDNARTPSGIGYALAAADVAGEVLGIAGGGADVREEIGTALRRCLEASAPDVDGELVLLSDGPSNAAWHDHRTLAELAGLEAVVLDDLRRRGDRVELADGRRVRAVYRRTDRDEVRDESGALTPIAELMLEPLRSGQVGMVNRFGAGAADDKFVYAYVDDLVRFFLSEEPLLPSVRTYDLLDPRRREEALDRLAELVAKPRDGQGGEGVVVGPVASPEEVCAARDAVAAAPEAWIVQDVITMSTHPTVVDGHLAPRHVDLRPFVLNDGAEPVVPRLGLTRVALQEGSMVVNSSREGGAKPTWVLAEEPADEDR